jgi:isorenieratene synthase
MNGDVNWTGPNEKFVCSSHGGRFDEDGNVIQGPPVSPLVTIKTRIDGDRLQLLGTLNEKKLSCRDVILATDTHAAQLLMEKSPNIDPVLLENVKKLDTTPVIVVRLWFDKTVVIDRELESGLTPDAEFIDNFFFVNTFSQSYNQEGIILEVQSYRVEKWIDASDQEILEVSFRDLASFLPQAAREKMTFFKLQRHLALFTKYAPGKAALRPSVSSGTYGLHLAGDWTEADWSVWMMERAVVSGLRAANAVLKRRGLPLVEIKRLPKEGITLRSSRFFGRLIRNILWRKYPG